MVRVAGVCTCVLLVPNLWPRANARLLLTLHPELAARVGLAPTPCGLTNRRATLTPPGNGAAGRIPTCIVPFRRRMPHVFGHDSILSLKLRIVRAEFGDEERKSQSTHK